MITHEEYLLLNNVQRDGYNRSDRIEQFVLMKKKLWLQRCTSTAWELNDRDVYYRLSSAGRLEHNLYEKENGYSDGVKLKPKGCPRCRDTDPMCPHLFRIRLP